MKKSDLKSGMVIEWKEGNKFLIVDQWAFGRNGKHSLNTYTEDLKDNLGSVSYDIVKVYTTNNENINLNNIFDENYLKLIWERKKEIDWTKLPKYTKVQVRNCDEHIWLNAYFIRRLGENESYSFPFVITFFDEFVRDSRFKEEVEYFEQCRIHSDIAIPKEWYK